MQTQQYFIAGPCAIESVEQFVGFADVLVRLFERYPAFRLVYKGSFDKANRTLSGSPRGIGLVEAEVAWSRLRETHPGLMLLTDVHETWQCRPAAAYCDVLQIPAFLGRQTDLITSAAKTGRVVNVKKPQWLPISYFDQVEHKLDGAAAYWFTYRGSVSVTTKLNFDMIEVGQMAGRYPHACVDLTHTNGGLPWMSRVLAGSAAVAGIRHFFAEVHPDRTNAICDADHQISTRTLEHCLDTILQVQES